MRVLTLLAALALAGCPQQSADEAPPLEEPCDGAGPFFAADPDTGTCYGPYQDCLLIPDGWASCRPCATDLDCGDLEQFHCVEQDAEVGATTPAGGRCEPGPGGAPPPVAGCSSNAACAPGEVCPAEFGGCSFDPAASEDMCPSTCEPSCLDDSSCAADQRCNAADVCAMAVDQLDGACRGWCVPR